MINIRTDQPRTSHSLFLKKNCGIAYFLNGSSVAFSPREKEARDLEPWPQKEGFGTTRHDEQRLSVFKFQVIRKASFS